MNFVSHVVPYTSSHLFENWQMSPEKRITLISYWLVCMPWLSSMIWKNNFKNKSKINNKPVDHVFVSKFRLRQWIYPIIVRGKYIDELQSCSVRSKINLMAMDGETRHVHSGKVRLCYASVHIGCLLRYVDSKQKNWLTEYNYVYLPLMRTSLLLQRKV